MKWLQFVTVSVLVALSSFAEVTRDTEWQDVPDTTKVGTVLDLGSGNIDSNAVRSIVRPMIADATNGIRSVDGAARPLPRYLHALDFADSYTNEAAAYYRSRGNGKTDGGCSAVRDGGFLYRNFDYPFDDRAEFVVRMSASTKRFASVGVAQVGTNLTETFVTSGKPSRCYKWLPGATVDGINENGVVAEINVVDGYPQTSGWHTTGDIHPLAAVRWILDNATNAQQAATYIAANIRFPQGWAQNFHYMIADETATYIVENGTAYPIIGRPVMTNFRIAVEPPDGQGIERYNILMNPANSITNAWYTRAYLRSTNWESEFKDAEEMEAAKQAWETHTKEQLRGHGLWQSVHTSVYDLRRKTLRIAVQEQDDWYVFQVPSAGAKVDAYTKAETDKKIKDATEFSVCSNSVGEVQVNTIKFTNPDNVKMMFDGDYGNVVIERFNSSWAAFGARIYSHGPYDVSYGSVAMGIGAVSHRDSVALGTSAQAPGSRSIAIGYSSTVWNRGTAVGWNSNAYGDYTSAFGYDSNAYADNATAIGANANANKNNSITIGGWDRTGEGDFYEAHDTNTVNFAVTDNPDSVYFRDKTLTQIVGNVVTSGIVRADNPAFSNAVMSVATGISTNDWAVIASVADWASVLPGGVPTGAGTLGAVLAALAATVLALKKKTSLLKSDGTAEDDFATDLLGKQVAKDAITASLADPFVAKTSGSYAEGDPVTYDGKLYKRNSTTGDDTSWVPAHWTETTVATLWNNADTTSYGGQN